MAPRCAARGVACLALVGAAEVPAAARPGVRWIAADGDSVPRMWSRGIAEAETELVLLTTAECTPATGWLRRILESPWAEIAALGGSLEVAADATAHDRAVHLLRYSAYLAHGAARDVGDLAADNAAYRRADLIACRREWERGFWDHFVHQRLRADGARLRFDPAVRVEFRSLRSIGDVVRERARHGQAYGRDRGRGMSRLACLLRFLSGPLLPAVLGARILARSSAAGRRGSRLLPALPLLGLYLCAWSAGEMRGYLHAAGAPSSAS